MPCSADPGQSHHASPVVAWRRERWQSCAVGYRSKRRDPRADRCFHAVHMIRGATSMTLSRHIPADLQGASGRNHSVTSLNSTHRPCRRATAAVAVTSASQRRQERAPMIESLSGFTAAGPGGLVSVGPGWPSPTGWAVASLAIAILALIARWASGSRRRRGHDDAPNGGTVSTRRQPTSATSLAQRGLTHTEQTGKEQP